VRLSPAGKVTFGRVNNVALQDPHLPEDQQDVQRLPLEQLAFVR